MEMFHLSFYRVSIKFVFLRWEKMAILIKTYIIVLYIYMKMYRDKKNPAKSRSSEGYFMDIWISCLYC